MKNIIVIISLIFISLSTNADYTLKYPLEQNQGGNLPNGSLIIKNNNQSISEIYDCAIPEPAPGNPNFYRVGKCDHGVLTVPQAKGSITGTCSNQTYSYIKLSKLYSGTCLSI